ncbi:hypothetical protein OS493_010725 [Desmophyllum pertusum]|uniref:GRF-type domain-containing protein n=1 Tax=Desmophyllum pertusum TaxID=174260 RepID=A0A9W9ZR68_9CNID|nr:hypothetical protein OS493_010725 [Desmophyllum pertusum]
MSTNQEMHCEESIEGDAIALTIKLVMEIILDREISAFSDDLKWQMVKYRNNLSEKLLEKLEEIVSQQAGKNGKRVERIKKKPPSASSPRKWKPPRKPPPRRWNQIDTYQKKLVYNPLKLFIYFQSHGARVQEQPRGQIAAVVPILYLHFFPLVVLLLLCLKMSTGDCPLCHRGELEEFTAKVDGKEYVRCKNKLCAIFCSVNVFEEYEDIIINVVADFYKGLDAPKCYHGQPTILKIKNEMCMQEKNRGKPYFICAQSQRCPYFTWSDTETEPVQPDEEVSPTQWIRVLDEKRDMNKQHHAVVCDLAKRLNRWRDRFSDLLTEFVLCEYCNEHKNEAYESGNDDRAKAWYPTNCGECKCYRRFFEDYDDDEITVKLPCRDVKL